MLTVSHRKFTLEEYHRLGELGFFQEHENVELIRGEIIVMPFKKTPHSVVNTRLAKQLYQLIENQATLRIQEPVILPHDSEPQPDVAIVVNKTDDYLSSHPYPSDILLIIEISDSTLSYDQEIKLRLYAEEGINDYWIFNLADNYLEVYQEPYQEPKGTFNYKIKQIYLGNEQVNLPCFPDLLLDLSLIFP